MTLEQIIKLLKTDGINSKKLVRDMLENASKKDLWELKRSISQAIAEKRSK